VLAVRRIRAAPPPTSSIEVYVAVVGSTRPGSRSSPVAAATCCRQGGRAIDVVKGSAAPQRAALETAPKRPPRPSDLLLDALAMLMTEGRIAAARALRKATRAFAGQDVTADDNFRCGWLTTVPSNVLWDDESWHAINARQLQLAHDAGALARLPIDLTASAVLAAWRGDLTTAAAVIGEADAITEATQTRIAPYGAMLLAALRGRETTALIDSAIDGAIAGGQGIAVQYAQWARAILCNGLGTLRAGAHRCPASQRRHT
jgi:hypothetical protein